MTQIPDNKTKESNNDYLPDVSVIIVTKNNHSGTIAAIESILANNYPTEKLEIVIIEETDKPEPIVLSKCIKYVTIPVKNMGVGFARNQGLKQATGEIIVFTDDDCIVDRHWLINLVQPIVDNKDAGASCGSVFVENCGPIGRCENILGFPGGGVKYLHLAKGKIVERSTFSTCNCAFRRNFRDDGLRFHEGFQFAGEDEVFSREISAKSKLLYNPDARVIHQARDSLFGVFRWFIRRGQASVEIIKFKKNKVKYFSHLMFTSQFVRLLALIGICILISVPIWPVLLLIFFFYYISVIVRYLWAWKYHPSVQVFILLPLVKAVMDVGMEIGIIKTILNRKRSGKK